jgi:hypothetical protein
MTIDDLLAIINIDELTIPVCRYNFDHDKLKINGSLYYHFMVEEKKVTFTQKGKKISVTMPYLFGASNNKDTHAKKENEEIFFGLDVVYRLFITLDEEAEIDEDTKKVFLESVVPRILHPYFRQTVAEALQKAGLPQLNLPLFENVSEPIKGEQNI